MRLFLLIILPLLFSTQCAIDKSEAQKQDHKKAFLEKTTVEVKDTFPVRSPSAERMPIDTTVLLTSIEVDYDTTQWTDVGQLMPSIVLDIKYASTDNFVKTKMYECGRCFLRPLVAEKIIQIHHELQAKGYGLKMFDCYRPRPVQQQLWDKLPDPRYVANPTKGSMHNRGGAVDLTIIDLKTGEDLDMGTPFDYFGEEAYHTYTKHSEEIASNRKLLKGTMEAYGFRSIRTEWWHYSLGGTSYPLDDMVWKCDH
ncbi:MAG: M15 family metallopeptidase [Bacteroidota bacterium]